MQRIALLLAGGSGDRFWPLSHGDTPKQLLRLLDKRKSLLEQSLSRVEPIFGAGSVFVVTSRQLASHIADVFPALSTRVFAEPAKRNTAGAVLWGTALFDYLLGPEELSIGVFTSDHAISNVPAFQKLVKEALNTAETSGKLVTIGIPPSRPESGFGYIQRGKAAGETAFEVEAFHEKPGIQEAQRLISTGTCLWNSGMVFATTTTLRRELQQSCPAHYEVFQRVLHHLQRGQTKEAEAAFEELPSESIDKALLEKSANVLVLEADFPWDDVGSWDALHRVLPNDANANVATGSVEITDSSGCVAYNANPDMTIQLFGLEDLVVVVTRDYVMVCPKSKAQEVRSLAERHREEKKTRWTTL